MGAPMIGGNICFNKSYKNGRVSLVITFNQLPFIKNCFHPVAVIVASAWVGHTCHVHSFNPRFKKMI